MIKPEVRSGRQGLSINPIGSLCVLLGLMFLMIVVSSLIGSVIVQLLPNERDALLCASVAQNLLAFAFPAWIIGRVLTGSDSGSFKMLGIFSCPSLKNLFGALCLFIIALPVIEQLILWNESMKLPEIMAGLEKTLRAWEDASQTITQRLLSDYSVGGLVSGVICIGIITGCCEEIFFRGAMQTILSKSQLGSIGAIWVTAIVFSVLHFQFFGFFPRMVLGLGFGYLFYWTRSIWVSAFVHTLNNSLVVIVAWLEGRGVIGTSDFGAVIKYFPVLTFVGLVLIFILLARKKMFSPRISNHQK